MKKLIAFFAIGASALAGQTNEVFPVLQTAARHYTNAIIKSATPAYVVVQHDGGLSKVQIPDLPKELAAKFNYNADTAALAIAQEKQADSAYQQQQRNVQIDRLISTAEKQKAKAEAELQSLTERLQVLAEKIPTASTERKIYRGDHLTRAGNFLGGSGAPVPSRSSEKAALEAEKKEIETTLIPKTKTLILALEKRIESLRDSKAK